MLESLEKGCPHVALGTYYSQELGSEHRQPRAHLEYFLTSLSGCHRRNTPIPLHRSEKQLSCPLFLLYRGLDNVTVSQIRHLRLKMAINNYARTAGESWDHARLTGCGIWMTGCGERGSLLLARLSPGRGDLEHYQCLLHEHRPDPSLARSPCPANYMGFRETEESAFSHMDTYPESIESTQKYEDIRGHPSLSLNSIQNSVYVDHREFFQDSLR